MQPQRHLQPILAVVFLWAAVAASGAFAAQEDEAILQVNGAKSGAVIKNGTSLRILCVGDSITAGFGSNPDVTGSWNGYRSRLYESLSDNDIDFVGLESAGNMTDNAFAAWSGKTISFIDKHVRPSLKQRPNIILLHAGTNDMSANLDFAVQGNDPNQAAIRLGHLIDSMRKECPDAVIVVAMIISRCALPDDPRTPVFQSETAKLVRERWKAGEHVLAANFTGFPESGLHADCVHPSPSGYDLLGDYWYDAVTQIPTPWIQEPVKMDPKALKPKKGRASTMRGDTRLLTWVGLAVVCSLLF